jgi:rubrerythrin
MAPSVLAVEVGMSRKPRSAASRLPVVRRRQWLKAMALLAWLPAFKGAGAAAYAATVAAMQSAREAEHEVYDQYTEFARRAQLEGYRGIAYLFTAFAASEQIHASNFGKMLTRLNVELAVLAKPAVRVGSTRENLMRAADGEMSSIDAFYPKLLEQLKPEGNEEAITLVRYAWSSEQQHRDKIKQIQRWTSTFFETVARTIDEKTGRYFVCQICGSTVNAVPPSVCPVCKLPSTHYRGIEPPG